MAITELNNSMTSQVNFQRKKTGGWVRLAASIGLIFLISALWLTITGAMKAHGSFNPANENLEAEIFVMFAMVSVCGILGVVSSVMEIRSGRKSATLTFFMIVTLFAAILTGAVASF